MKDFLHKHIIIDNKVYFFSQLMTHQTRTTFAVLIEKKMVKNAETNKEEMVMEKLHLPVGTLMNRIQNGFAKVISNDEAKQKGQVIE
jgi:hypothetical protein